ncbi:hypothetical protein H5397_15435 [Propioniciclava sp. MC1683]|uniref:hypothetical protein n=1 Tax=Propioniciclava sp. MC1683 TaxID=2760309 RepID=UPI0016009630|nr:hypothetical protein [Propioniciclava sp. MC1683]MBB1502797.1 hypothetical protein [Propioniciclava sp. MC1683]
MGTATVETLTREQANEERAKLLEALGESLVDLRERAEDHLLDPEEVARWRRVEELTWLLGE